MLEMDFDSFHKKKVKKKKTSVVFDIIPDYLKGDKTPIKSKKSNYQTESDNLKNQVIQSLNKELMETKIENEILRSNKKANRRSVSNIDDISAYMTHGENNIKLLDDLNKSLDKQLDKDNSFTPVDGVDPSDYMTNFKKKGKTSPKKKRNKDKDNLGDLFEGTNVTKKVVERNDRNDNNYNTISGSYGGNNNILPIDFDDNDDKEEVVENIDELEDIRITPNFNNINAYNDNNNFNNEPKFSFGNSGNINRNNGNYGSYNPYRRDSGRDSKNVNLSNISNVSNFSNLSNNLSGNNLRRDSKQNSIFKEVKPISVNPVNPFTSNSNSNSNKNSSKEIKHIESQLKEDSKNKEHYEKENKEKEEKCKKLEEEITKLQSTLNERTSENDIINSKINDLTKHNNELIEESTNFEEKIIKRKEKFDKEMILVQDHLKEVEGKTKELGKKYKQSLEEVFDLEQNALEVSTTKSEEPIQKTNKDLESKKRKYEKNIFIIKTDILKHEQKLNEFNELEEKSYEELKIANEELKEAMGIHEELENKVNELKQKHDDIKNIKFKEKEKDKDGNGLYSFLEDFSDYERSLKRKNNEANGLKEIINGESIYINMIKKMEKIYNDEYNDKLKKYDKLKLSLNEINSFIGEIQEENKEYIEDNNVLFSKYKLLDSEYKQKKDIETQTKSKDLVILKEKELNYGNLYNELRSILKKKQKIVISSNEINLKIMELVKAKKKQIQLYEVIVDTNNKDKSHEQKFKFINDKEEEMLKKLFDNSNMPDKLDPSEDEDDYDYEDSD